MQKYAEQDTNKLCTQGKPFSLIEMSPGSREVIPLCLMWPWAAMMEPRFAS